MSVWGALTPVALRAPSVSAPPNRNFLLCLDSEGDQVSPYWAGLNRVVDALVRGYTTAARECAFASEDMQPWMRLRF